MTSFFPIIEDVKHNYIERKKKWCCDSDTASYLGTQISK